MFAHHTARVRVLLAQLYEVLSEFDSVCERMPLLVHRVSYSISGDTSKYVASLIEKLLMETRVSGTWAYSGRVKVRANTLAGSAERMSGENFLLYVCERLG